MEGKNTKLSSNKLNCLAAILVALSLACIIINVIELEERIFFTWQFYLSISLSSISLISVALLLIFK